MRAFRRAVVAVTLAAVIAAVLRLRGSSQVPAAGGGWRALSGPDLS